MANMPSAQEEIRVSGAMLVMSTMGEYPVSMFSIYRN
jgi:hypothetical protein